jgi:hypothetical protein
MGRRLSTAQAVVIVALMMPTILHCLIEVIKAIKGP